MACEGCGYQGKGGSAGRPVGQVEGVEVTEHDAGFGLRWGPWSAWVPMDAARIIASSVNAEPVVLPEGATRVADGLEWYEGPLRHYAVINDDGEMECSFERDGAWTDCPCPEPIARYLLQQPSVRAPEPEVQERCPLPTGATVEGSGSVMSVVLRNGQHVRWQHGSFVVLDENENDVFDMDVARAAMWLDRALAHAEGGPPSNTSEEWPQPAPTDTPEPRALSELRRLDRVIRAAIEVHEQSAGGKHGRLSRRRADEVRAALDALRGDDPTTDTPPPTWTGRDRHLIRTAANALGEEGYPGNKLRLLDIERRMAQAPINTTVKGEEGPPGVTTSWCKERARECDDEARRAVHQGEAQNYFMGMARAYRDAAARAHGAAQEPDSGRLAEQLKSARADLALMKADRDYWKAKHEALASRLENKPNRPELDDTSRNGR